MENGSTAWQFEYYQPTFLWIMTTHSQAIRRALFDEPKCVRKKFFASFPPGAVFCGAEGHTRLREYLNVLEASIQSKLQHHSLPFWLHIYRRIGPYLSPSHENKRDEVTVRLVRDIVECAITKYSRLSNTRDIRRSKDTPAELILGGLFLRRLKPLMRARKEREELIRQLRASDQLVLCDFRASDLVAIYGVEGLAYEYWLTTARLRSIGKGDRQILDVNGELTHEANADLDYLISSFDSRASRHGTMSTLAGTFFPSRDRTSGSGRIFTPVYNARQDRAEELLTTMGFPSNHSPTPILNFLPTTVPIASIVDAHQFLSQRFLETRGYSLERFLLVLAGLSWRAALPERRLARLLEGDKTAISSSFLQALRRAYVVVEPDLMSIAASAHWYIQNWIRADSSDEPLTVDLIAKVIRDLTLDSAAQQARIALWTLGPRSVVLRTDGTTIIDVQGLLQLLKTLFVGLRHSEQQRGMSFEESVRVELMRNGHELLQRRFKLPEGEREVDAVVRVRDTLWLIEAFSMERPLDFEIGKPDVIEIRNAAFGEKLEQVASVRASLEQSSTGENYDFRWARSIQHCVVSPFIEWIWSREPSIWLSNTHPRILSIGELIDLLGESQ